MSSKTLSSKILITMAGRQSFVNFLRRKHSTDTRIYPSPSRDSSTKFEDKVIGQELQHVYKRIFPWKNDKEMCEHISSNVLLHKEHLIAVNKPYGLGIRDVSSKKQYSQKIVQTLNTVLCSDYRSNFSQVLPRLADQLGFKKLDIVKAPERFNSGVTLLSADEKHTAKIKKCFLRGQASKQTCEEYWAVTLGAPLPRQGVQKVAIMMQTSEFNNTRRAVITQDLSKKAIAEGKGKYIAVEYETLSTNDEGSASLVRISVSNTTWHFVRVYLASLLSPVLGDNVHGSRVNMHTSPPRHVNPFSYAAQMPQQMKPTVLNDLELRPGIKAIVPVHLHLRTVAVPGYLDKNNDLLVTAPPPATFVWTCLKLGLNFPQQDSL